MADTSSSSDGSSSWLSTLGSGVGNFLTSSGGQQLLGGLATGGVGLYQMGQATKQGNQAAGQIQGTVTPSQNLSNATLGQLQGQGQVGGPMGTAIAGQQAAAGELTGVAQQYSTGQLTSAQQTQVQQTVAAQKAQVDQQLAAAGNMDSSARAAAHQQIDNNAAILTQQLVNQNLQMAEGAQTSVSNTYNALLGDALNQAKLGLTGTQQAVQTQLANDQQVQAALQQIMQGISTQLASASGGGQVAQGSPMGQAGEQIAAGLQKYFGGGGGGVAGGGVAAGAAPLWSAGGNVNYMVNTAEAQGAAQQQIVNQADVAAQTYQPTLDLSGFSYSDPSTGWGGYTASNIDYSGYTGG